MTALRLPNLIIVGTGKAGTTSLFYYLSQHPEVCVSRVKEIQYFNALTDRDGVLPPIQEYAEHFQACGAERYRLEASPQYFHGGQVIIDAMRETLGDPRIVLSLRDPIDRLWSTFRFVKSRMGPIPPEQTFDQYIDLSVRLREERAEHTAENRAHWTLNGGFYVEFLQPWLAAFGDDMRVVFSEDLAARPSRVVGDLCRWLDIDDAVAEAFSYSVENRTAQFRSKALQRIALKANDPRLFGSRRRLKAPLRKLYYAVNKQTERERMSPDTRRRLEAIYSSANEELASELIDRGYQDLPGWLAHPVRTGAGG